VGTALARLCPPYEAVNLFVPCVGRM
jgi:hypothetical protein